MSIPFFSYKRVSSLQYFNIPQRAAAIKTPLNAPGCINHKVDPHELGRKLNHQLKHPGSNLSSSLIDPRKAQFKRLASMWFPRPHDAGFQYGCGQPCVFVVAQTILICSLIFSIFFVLQFSICNMDLQASVF